MEAVKKTEKKDESGTKPNTRSKDGRYRIKITSLRELFVYDQRNAFGLSDVLSGHYSVKRTRWETLME